MHSNKEHSILVRVLVPCVTIHETFLFVFPIFDRDSDPDALEQQNAIDSFEWLKVAPANDSKDLDKV